MYACDESQALCNETCNTRGKASFELGGAATCRNKSKELELQASCKVDFDWHILPDQLKMCTYPDGRDHVLGVGGFGTVSLSVYVCLGRLA